jgi:vacuolar-type H+-ATPase subunit I/STV1
MDPFSLAVGTLTIAGAALQSITALIHDIKAINHAPDVIADLRDELVAVNAVLIALDEARKNAKLDALTPDVKDALQLAIVNCQRACDKFGKKLKRWTKHSDENVWWNRVRIGLFAEATIKALSEQLNRCKNTVNTAVSMAALYVVVCAHAQLPIAEYVTLILL